MIMFSEINNFGLSSLFSTVFSARKKKYKMKKQNRKVFSPVFAILRFEVALKSQEGLKTFRTIFLACFVGQTRENFIKYLK